MHDPMTVAHKLYLGRKVKKNGNYRSSFITIWHVDPETDGTDDSCGWFIRQRHIDKKLIEKIRTEFQFNFNHNYWFNASGYPNFSTMGVVLEMYSRAVWIIFMYYNDGKPNSRRYKRFMRKYLFDILHFAENSTDSLSASIKMKYGVENKEERVNHFVSVVAADIMRKLRPWYKHPRWHIHHWKVQFYPFQRLKRRFWDKCCICGKRGFKSAPIGDWDGTKIWHQECDKQSPKPLEPNVSIIKQP